MKINIQITIDNLSVKNDILEEFKDTNDSNEFIMIPKSDGFNLSPEMIDFLISFTSGLSINFDSGVDDFDDYIGQIPRHNLSSAGEWFSEVDVESVTIDYDLGDVFVIDRIAFWNEESAGIGHFRI